MKKIVVVLLALLMICGCGQKDYTDAQGNEHIFGVGSEMINAVSFPVPFELNGEKCVFERVTFYKDEDVVYLIAWIDTTEVKKPFEEDFAQSHFLTTAHGAESYSWGYAGTKYITTEKGNLVMVCTKFKESELSENLTYHLSASNDKKVSILTDSGTKTEARTITAISIDVPVSYEPFEDLPTRISTELQGS